MTDTLDPDQLATARAKIDDIDDRLLGLLRDRARIVEDVAAAKRAAGQETRSAFRPEREAMILRRLHADVKAAGGVPSFAGVVRVWREIMSAALVQQEPVTVGIPSDERLSVMELRQLAREHFGGSVEFQDAGTADELFAKVQAERNLIGLTDNLSKFANASVSSATPPRVFAALPFCGDGRIEAFAFGHVDLAESGDDETLMAVWDGTHEDKYKAHEAFEEAGFPTECLGKSDGIWVYSIVGFHVPPAEPGPLSDATRSRSFGGSMMLGAYARPIDLAQT